MRGRRLPTARAGHHYPCMTKPSNYAVARCDHPTIKPQDLPEAFAGTYPADLDHVIASSGVTQYRDRRAKTGICKPSILSGLGEGTLEVPRMCSGDIMHLVLNLGDLLFSLWRGNIDHSALDNPSNWPFRCLVGETWDLFGKAVVACTPYLPSSYDRPPRNPALKINSGYKQREFLNLLFGLGPGLLHSVLKPVYWRSYCKLVVGIRHAYRRSSTLRDLRNAHRLLIEFILEFEAHYVQDRADRVHFVRQSIHVLSHLMPEFVRVGPGACSSQFPMERTIGNLTQELRSRRYPYANLSAQGMLRCQINSLLAMVPTLEGDTSSTSWLPSGAYDVGGGYYLLPRTDRTARRLPDDESNALRTYFRATDPEMAAQWANNWVPRVRKWARLRLPNGQVARSVFKEDGAFLQRLRVCRNVKVSKIYHLDVVLLRRDRSQLIAHTAMLRSVTTFG
jgi:hypothetical protein